MPQHRIVPVPNHPTPDLRAFAGAVHAGFFIPEAKDAGFELWHRGLLADGAVLRAVFDDDRPFGLADQPVATFASWRGTINTGTGLVPADLISYVTVQPSHRRRGLMRELMLADLAAARARGDVFAALIAADTRIYGRFGFGIAATNRRLRVETGDGFDVRTRPRGRTVLAEASAIAEVRRRIFEQCHAAQFLSVSRPEAYWLPAVDWETQELLPERGVVHLGPDGAPEAAATFTVAGGEIRILDLVGASPAAEIEVVRLLGEAEGTAAVLWDRCSDPDHPLRLALTDPRRMKTLAEFDAVWLRVLDVPRALRARAYEADGDLTIAVDDPLGEQTGGYHLVVRDGRAGEVGPAVRDADVTVTMSGLAPLYSGLASATALAAAGHAEGSPAGLAAADALFGRRLRPIVSSDF